MVEVVGELGRMVKEAGVSWVCFYHLGPCHFLSGFSVEA